MEETRCWSCKGAIDAADKYCRHCGKGQSSLVPWYYGHFGIIFLSLVALGPLGLFLVWRAPKLSREIRVVYTVLILAYTWWLGVKMYEFWRLAQLLTLGYN